MLRAIFFGLLLTSLQVKASVTQAKQAILIDAHTGEVLFEKNADELMAPSSMTKIATVMAVFQELKSGNLSEEDLLPVSKLAWKKGGSRMFLEIGTMVRVKDLLKGVTVQSGNDAAIVLAEGLYGNEAIFATEMTRLVHRLGATKTTFKNVTGWPDPTHLSTARDLATMTRALLKQYSDLYRTYFGIKEFTYNNIRQQNRNPLLYKTDLKSDGVKTGHTSMGGYGMVGTSVAPDGTRLIVVVNGLKTRGERARDAYALLKWGEKTYTTPKLFTKGDRVVDANLWLGTEAHVPLVIAEDLFLTVKRDDIPNIKVNIIYDEPLSVKLVKAGDEVGYVEVVLPNEKRLTAPLIVSKDVEQASFFKRIYSALHYIAFGHNA